MPCGPVRIRAASVRRPCGAARTHQITWTDAARIRTDNTFNVRAAYLSVVDAARTPHGRRTDAARTPHGRRTDAARTPHGRRTDVRAANLTVRAACFSVRAAYFSVRAAAARTYCYLYCWSPVLQTGDL